MLMMSYLPATCEFFDELSGHQLGLAGKVNIVKNLRFSNYQIYPPFWGQRRPGLFNWAASNLSGYFNSVVFLVERFISASEYMSITHKIVEFTTIAVQQ